MYPPSQQLNDSMLGAQVRAEAATPVVQVEVGCPSWPKCRGERETDAKRYQKKDTTWKNMKHHD